MTEVFTSIIKKYANVSTVQQVQLNLPKLKKTTAGPIVESAKPTLNLPKLKRV